MLSLFCLAVIAAEPNFDGVNSSLTLKSTTAESLPLPSPLNVQLGLHAIERRITLDTSKGAQELFQALKKQGSHLCPNIQLSGNRVTLTCRSRRLDAVVRTVASRQFLDLSETRGVPVRQNDEGPSAVAFSLSAAGLGDKCPGETDAARAECAYAAHKPLAEVEAFLRKALNTADRNYAAMRLGDVVMQLRNDPVEALKWYQLAGKTGAFGRLAVVRVCELTANCVGKRQRYFFDAAALEEPMRTELELRAIRFNYFYENDELAIETMARRLMESGRLPLCRDAHALCEMIIKAALDEEDTRSLGLNLFLWYRTSEKEQPASLVLYQAAASAAADAGAFRFAGNLSAVVTPRVPADELEAHLRRTIGYFRDAGEPARVQVLIEFAQTRLPETILKSSTWKAFVAASSLQPAERKLQPLDEKSEKETSAAISEAQALRAQVASFQSAGETP